MLKSMLAAAAVVLLGANAAMAECTVPSALNTCKSCHELDAGKKSKGTGPNISAVHGAKAMQAADYTKYSEAMKAAAEKGLVWTDDALFKYLADQAGFLKEFSGKDLPNGMKIATHKDEQKRKDAIAALKELKACK